MIFFLLNNLALAGNLLGHWSSFFAGNLLPLRNLDTLLRYWNTGTLDTGNSTKLLWDRRDHFPSPIRWMHSWASLNQRVCRMSSSLSCMLGLIGQLGPSSADSQLAGTDHGLILGQWHLTRKIVNWEYKAQCGAVKESETKIRFNALRCCTPPHDSITPLRQVTSQPCVR